MIRQHPLTKEKLNQILAVARTNPRDFAMLTIAANHAIRASELAALRTDDINLRDRTIRVRRLKGSITTTEELLDSELAPLTAWLDTKPANDLLFPSPRGQALCRMQVYRIFRGYAEAASAPATSRSSHAFRHTLGQDLASAGVDIKKLQIIMGHKNINSTSQYFTFTQRECDQAKRQIFAMRGGV